MSTLQASRALQLVVFATALFCAAGLWHAIAVIGLRLPLDPNEGWNAYHAAAAMGAGPLYPGPQSFMVDNYPPLSFYFVGALGRLLGDNIVAGRIVSLLSLGVVTFGIFTAACRMGCERMEALFAALFFVGGLLAFTDYVGMDDPQMLAHAIAMTGFLLLLREPRSSTSVAVSALLFVLAAFAKHNVVAMALGMTAWLAFYDRRTALRLVLFGLSVLLFGLVVFQAVYGTGLLAQLVSARLYSLADLRSGLETWLNWSFLPLAGLAALALRCEQDRFVHLCALYALCGTALGISFLGGAGVDANVLFDADIALALSSALLLNRIAVGVRAPFLAAAFGAPLLFAAGANADSNWWSFEYWRHPMREETSLARSDIGFLAVRPGPALCEMQSFCYWADKPEGVDVFNIGEQFDTGARSDAALVRLIEARRFAVIQFDPDSPYSLGENVHNAVARAYRLDHEDDFGSFYVPK